VANWDNPDNGKTNEKNEKGTREGTPPTQHQDEKDNS